MAATWWTFRARSAHDQHHAAARSPKAPMLSGRFSSARVGAWRFTGRNAMANPCACLNTLTRSRRGPSASTAGASHARSTLPVASRCRRRGGSSNESTRARISFLVDELSGRRQAVARADPQGLSRRHDDVRYGGVDGARDRARKVAGATARAAASGAVDGVGDDATL